METTSEIIVGLDIGTTKVVAIVGRKSQNNKVEVLGFGKTDSIGVLRGSVINVDKTAETIRLAVETAELRSGVSIREVYVGIAGQHIKSRPQRSHIIRQYQDEEISHKEVVDLINSMYRIQVEPGEKIIHVIPQEFIVDGVPGISKEDVVGMSGVKLEGNFHIVTGNVSAIRNITRSVEKADLEIAGLILEPLVSAEAVLDEKDKEAGVALIDIGGGTTDLAVFHSGGLCHTAVIPLAGHAITQDIQDGCTIIKAQAEALKQKFGSALSSENKAEDIVSIPGLRGRAPKEISLKNLAGIIEARMSDILEVILFELRNAGYENKLIAGLVLTGGGAKLKHVAQLTEFITGVDSRLGYPSEHLASGCAEELADPSYATAVGLLIYGIQSEEEQNALTIEKNQKETPIVEKKEETPSPEISKPVKRKAKKQSPLKGLFSYDIKDKMLDFFSAEDED